MIAIPYLSIAIAILLLASVIVSKAASRLGVPSWLLFLMIRILAGCQGLDGLSTWVGRNGFIAGYIAGLVVVNSSLPQASKNIFSFYEALA